MLDAQIENKPAVDVIRAHNGSEVLIYADPPYVHATRTAHLKSYTCEMTDAAHIELLRALQEHEGMVLLSGYDSEMYRELLLGVEHENKEHHGGAGRKENGVPVAQPGGGGSTERDAVREDGRGAER